MVISIITCMIPSHVTSGQEEYPQLTFGIWGSVSFPTELTSEPLIQRILFCIRVHPKQTVQISREVGGSVDEIQAKITELARCFLVKKQGDSGWVADIPIFARAEIEIATEIGHKYGQIEANILENSIPKLQKTYEQCQIAEFCPWSQAALIVVGALCADFCVSDRVPFRPEYFDEAFLPPLHPDGRRWGYVGQEVAEAPSPYRRYQFYQNVSRDSEGGLSRFGYYRLLDEGRQSPPSQAERLRHSYAGRIWLSFAEGPLSLKEISERAGIETEVVEATVHEMFGWNPPGLIKTDGKYTSNIPVFSPDEFKLLLVEADRIAEIIHQNVTIPMQKELEAEGKRLGLRFPLPSDTSARDIALQLLSEERKLPPIMQPPVPWNFGVWGWQGHLKMWEEVQEISSGTSETS